MKKTLVILTCALFLFAFAGIILAENESAGNNSGNNTVCTMDAKLCSDGSYVSRNANNNCRFNACPDDDEEDDEDDDKVICAMDVKICPDGTEVGRTNPNCEFRCPQQYNFSKERVCCKIYGYGAEMQEVNVKYKITEKRECRIPEGFVGENKEIVNNSYCIEQIKENRQDFLNKKEEIIRERNKIKLQYRNQSILNPVIL